MLGVMDGRDDARVRQAPPVRLYPEMHANPAPPFQISMV
jgi:hypothetical protein